jgi:lysophospholipase L1-like esterase
MGSSYAAGAWIGALAPDSPQRCGRTQNNYAHLLAARMSLELTDVSCGGATTSQILGSWSDLAPQIDALTADTRLVTVTVGGNDLDYVKNLMAATCYKLPSTASARHGKCPPLTWPTPIEYLTLEQHLREIAQAVRRRSPQAVLVFVEYVRILPNGPGCASVPLGKAESTAARKTFRQLSEVTERAANAEGAFTLKTGQLSKGHDACAKIPWGAGHPGKPADWHPTAAGHEAIAEALFARLSE